MRLVPVTVVTFILAIGLVGPSSAETAGAQAQDRLYLLPPAEPSMEGNFTTNASSSEEQVAMWPWPVKLAEGTWSWRTERVPEDWSVSEGTVFRLSLQFVNLHKVVPLVDARAPPEALGKVQIRAGILHTDASEPIFSSWSFLEPDLLAESTEPVPVMFEIAANRSALWSAGPDKPPAFGVQVVIIGRMSSGDPVQVLVGGDAPAYLDAPGFPIQPFGAWEEMARRSTECNRIILEGGSCDAKPLHVQAETNEAPGLGTFMAVVSLAALALCRRTRCQQSSL